MAGEEDNNNNTVAFTGEESIPDNQETIAAPDEASVDAAAPPAKKRGRKRKTEKEAENGESVRRSERARKNSRSLNEDYLTDVEEDLELKKIKGKRGRKKKVAIGVGVSDEINAAQEGEKPECIEQQQMVTSYDLFC
jgi:acetyl-CoA carboxylase alpha subunit